MWVNDEKIWQQGVDGSWWYLDNGRWVPAHGDVARRWPDTVGTTGGKVPRAGQRTGSRKVALAVVGCLAVVSLLAAVLVGAAAVAGPGGDWVRGQAQIEGPAAEGIDDWVREVEDYWERNEQEVPGLRYSPIAAADVRTDSSAALECGGTTYGPDDLEGNAFYCTEDYVYLDRELLELMGEEVGPSVPVYIVAHEFGHRVQNLSNSFPDVVLAAELQADCYAAAFMADAVEREALSLGPDPLGDVLRAAVLIGDSVELSALDPMAHGTGFDRAGASWTGWNEGLGACVALGTDLPVTVQGNLPAGGGGDLDRELVVPVVLDVMASTFPGRVLGPGDVVRACTGGGRGTRACADGTLAIDEDEVSELYDEFGDMAAWVPVITAYVELDGGRWNSWCAAGALAGELVDGVDSASAGTTIYLSGEDLDELLIQVSQEADGADGFARIETVRRGFVDGWSACD